MNYTDALRQIKHKQMQASYLLYGEETYLLQQLEQQIIGAVLAPHERDMNLTILERDRPVSELISLINTIPFMGGKNIVVVRGTNLFRSRSGGADAANRQSEKAEEALILLLADMPDHSILVFTTPDKVDKRRKLFKSIEQHGAAIECKPFKIAEVRVWLNEKLAEMDRRLQTDAMEHLMAVIAVMPQISLGFLASEMQKLALYTHGKQVISYNDLNTVISALPEVSVFAMIEALSQKQTAKALSLLQRQIAAGEHPLRMLALLSRQVRMLWQAKEFAKKGYEGKQIASMLGIPPFVGDKLLRQGKNFTFIQMKEALVALAAADKDFKSGKADNILLENIIIALCC